MNFPVSLDDFIVYQEQLAHRKVFHNEREAIAAWLPFINDAYENGLDEGDLDMIDTFISRADSPNVVHFLKVTKAWMVRADSSRKAATA